MMRVEIKPELLSWARERAGYDRDALAHRFPKLTDWERGTTKPTLKQIEKFASAMHAPIGFLFLPQPPSLIHECVTDQRRVTEADLKRVGASV